MKKIMLLISIITVISGCRLGVGVSVGFPLFSTSFQGKTDRGSIDVSDANGLLDLDKLTKTDKLTRDEKLTIVETEMARLESEKTLTQDEMVYYNELEDYLVLIK